LLAVAGKLDLTVGGKSFEAVKEEGTFNRRAAYMSRGYLAYTNAMPDYLQTFDAEDGRMTCPRRNQTVTAPQALFMMNNELMALMIRTTPMDASANYRYYMNQMPQDIQNRFMPITNPFLNVFNWAKFLKQLKENKKNK